MALNAGTATGSDPVITTGLTAELTNSLFTAITNNGGFNDLSAEQITVMKDSMSKIINSIVVPFIDHIKNKADVKVISNVAADIKFWTWLTGFVAVISVSGGVTLTPAMNTFLATNPIPTSLDSIGTGSTISTKGVN